MLAHVVDCTATKHAVGPWSEWHADKAMSKEHVTPHGNYAYDSVEAIQDHNSVTFNYHYKEKTTNVTDGYQTVTIFKQQVALASEHFKDCDFQLITFNVHEEDKFGHCMKALGFELMSSALGRSNTPITLYVKTKGK